MRYSTCIATGKGKSHRGLKCSRKPALRRSGTVIAHSTALRRGARARFEPIRHMMQRIFCQRRIFVAATHLLITLAGASFLTSCSTTPAPSASSAGFKFWVLRYKPPVDAAAWVPDAAASADAEGAALNIAAAMRQGNMEQWLSNWQTSERPNLTTAQSEALLHEWQPLQGSHVCILGRVVAEADVIVELSVAGPQNEQGKIQIPLKRAQDRWWLTTMDPASEYLHWESSPNKLIDYINPDAFQKHLNIIPKSKDKAEAAPAKGATPLAGL